jgi:hypothetical protein
MFLFFIGSMVNEVGVESVYGRKYTLTRVRPEFCFLFGGTGNNRRINNDGYGSG